MKKKTHDSSTPFQLVVLVGSLPNVPVCISFNEERHTCSPLRPSTQLPSHHSQKGACATGDSRQPAGEPEAPRSPWRVVVVNIATCVHAPEVDNAAHSSNRSATHSRSPALPKAHTPSSLLDSPATTAVALFPGRDCLPPRQCATSSLAGVTGSSA